MDKWWESAPLADQPQADKWWEAAPVVNAAQPSANGFARAAQYADDLVRLAANGLTFGLADKAESWVRGTGAAAEATKTADAKERTGLAGTGAHIVGSLLPAGAIAKGVGVAARGLPYISNPFAQAAISGAGYGGTDAAINDRPILPEAAIGAGAGIVGQGAASGVLKALGVFNKRPAIPTQEDLKAAAQRAYQAADDAGVVLGPDAVSRLRGGVEKTLADFGYAPELHPGVPGFLNNLGRMEGENVTLKGMDTLRKTAGHLRASHDPSTAAIGGKLTGEIDNFLTGLSPSDVVAGDAAKAVSALREARGLWQRSSKADAITRASDSAELRAASTGSGGNVDNATRQNMRQLLEKERGWTPDERQALQDIVKGTPTQNALRLAGKLSPHGNGLMTALGLGATAVNPLMGVPMMLGGVSKYTADKMTDQSVRGLLDVVLAGGSRAATQATPNAAQRLANEKSKLIRGLLTVGIASGDAGLLSQK